MSTERFRKAFGLNDNPFRPTEPLGGVKNPSTMKELDTHPLRVHKEPKLFSLYCGKAGPFEKHLHDFRERIAQDNYCIEPPSVGMNSFAFLIEGYKGTGKTSLANAMIHHLEQCHSNNHDWHFKELNKEFLDQKEQSAEIAKLGEGLDNETKEGDYCWILIDNLHKGAEMKAFEVAENLNDKDRIVFLFLLTNEEISQEYLFNSKHQPTPFMTKPVSSDEAYAFVKCRIDFYRSEPKLPFIDRYKLFPFDEDDIRDAVKSGVITGAQEGKITIRMLGVLLYNCIFIRLQELNKDFDVSVIPDKDVADNIIHVSEYYKKIVNKRQGM